MTENEKIDLEPYVQELAKTLDGKADADTIRSELEKYVYKYEIGIESAKNGVLRKFGSPRPSFSASSESVTKKISELEGTEMNVKIVARIVFVENRQINSKGVDKTIISGIAGDDTGTVPFTIWSDSETCEKGATYTFCNAYTKKWRDQVQVNIGSRGKLIPNTDANFKVATNGNFGEAAEVKIGDINDQTRNVTVTGRVLEVESRVVNIKGEDRTLYGGMLGDETGKIQFTAWNDFSLKAGDVICAKNAYIRSWKGIPQLNLGDRTEVSRSDKAIGEVSTGTTARTVEDVMKVGGGLDISITGTIVDVRAGSGLIKRCPQCNRSVMNNECSVHGPITPVMDIRLKTTVDDGTGAISVIINRQDTEKITGMTLEQAEAMFKEKGELSAVANKMAGTVLLKKITVTGNVMSDDYGPQMSARTTEITNTDVVAEAKKLYDEMEASL